MAETNQDIYSYITSEVNNFQILPVVVCEGYEWNLSRHVKLTTLYKNSQFETGNSDDKPFRNIMRPILNLQYRAEGFDVKDIVLFVDDRKNYYKSFLVKKYHNKWAKENSMDTFIDEMVETYVDFGGTLAKKVKGKVPEVVPWQSIAFCDQTDIMSGPICIKHFYSPDKLKEMEKVGWGNEASGANISIDELIQLSKAYKVSEQGRQTSTPGKYIEVYELHGMLPEWWLEEGEPFEPEPKYAQQLQVVGFYQKEGDMKKQGVCLYKGKEKNPFKFVKRDPVFGKALGTGGAEELFEAQVWTNYSAIVIKDMLDAASKVLLQTSDPAVGKRNKLRNMANLEIVTTEEGKRLEQINTVPVNLKLFENAIAEWELSARTTGSANDPQLGVEPKPGTAMGLQKIVVRQGEGLHEYRRGKLATFLGEIYRDWIIPQIVEEINQGQEFLAELDLEELQSVADAVSSNYAEDVLKEKVLNGESIEQGEREALKQEGKDRFRRGGNKKFIKILKQEMKDSPVDVSIDIVGKQRNIGQMADSLVNIFKFIFSNPQGFMQVMQMPGMAKVWNEFLEYSGLSPMDFNQMSQSQMQQLQQPVGQVAPQLANQNLARALQ